jgi:ABC-type transport system substrate-binding protein
MQFAWVPEVEIPIIPPYQLTIDGWSGDYPDPQEFLSQRWSSSAPASRIAGTAVTLPQVDAWLSQADGMVDSTARQALCQQTEQLLVDQPATFRLWQYLQTHAVRSRVVNWSVAPTQVTPLGVWQSAYIER